VSFAFELTKDWIHSKDVLRRRCGYGLLYELSKNQKHKQLTDEFFLECIERMRNEIETEDNRVRLSMGGALIGIGKRNKKLNRAAVRLAKSIGPLDYGESNCEPLDILKHLTSDYIKKKLGIPG